MSEKKEERIGPERPAPRKEVNFEAELKRDSRLLKDSKDALGKDDFDAEQIRKMLQEIHVVNGVGDFGRYKYDKYRQVLDYIKQIDRVFDSYPKNESVTFLDCGCGKSYLSFILYQHCRDVLKRKVRIIGVDRNPDLIAKCNESAKKLGFENMQFYAANIGNFQINEKINVLYSLHACDTATDMMIAQGVNVEADYIFSVSCCQKTNRRNMSGGPISALTRFQHYKERIVDMVGDTMRSLLLEHLGYKVQLLEFTPSETTPKNIVLVADRKHMAKYKDYISALPKYLELKSEFHFAPKLEEYLFPRIGVDLQKQSEKNALQRNKPLFERKRALLEMRETLEDAQRNIAMLKVKIDRLSSSRGYLKLAESKYGPLQRGEISPFRLPETTACLGLQRSAAALGVQSAGPRLDNNDAAASGKAVTVNSEGDAVGLASMFQEETEGVRKFSVT